jgi:hypothetical protein
LAHMRDPLCVSIHVTAMVTNKPSSRSEARIWLRREKTWSGSRSGDQGGADAVAAGVGDDEA